MTKNFVITYKALNSEGALIKEGKMRVKKKMSSLAAQIAFESYLKGKLYSFDRLIVISCEEENPLMSMFGGSSSNPFNF